MKSWKKKWLDELNSVTPELSDEVRNAPIPAAKGEYVANVGGAAVKLRGKRNWIIAATALLLCLAIAGTVLLIPKSNAGLYTVEINPSVSFVTDGNGRVTNVLAVNSDADVILSNRETRSGLIGKKIDAAIEYYVDCAARLGYLNLNETGSAVRVSACNDKNTDKILKNVSASLQNYFTSKGVFAVVVADSVSIEEFCERSGLQKTASVKDLKKTVKDSATLVSERNVTNMTVEQLQDSYKNLIGDYDEFMLSHIRDNIDLIIENASAIEEILKLNDEIEANEGNPSIWFKDYWSVKTLYADLSQSTEEFRSLMAQMESELAAYEQKYGTEFANKLDLLAANNKYRQLPVSLEELKEWLADITASIVGALSDILSDIMEIAGVLDETVGELMKLPETVEDYLVKTVGALQRNFERRLADYGEIYSEVRESITSEDYGNYVDGLIARYGSLDAYWSATHQ